MIRRSMLPRFVLLLSLGVAGCTGVDGFYEKEFMLHDGTRAEAERAAAASKAKEERAAAKEKTAQEKAAKDKAMTPPVDETVTGEVVVAEAGASEVAVAAFVEAAPDGDIERIFVLENLYDELGRAIRDGVGDLEALQQKQNDVSRELVWRRVAVGDAYPEARRERLELLRTFPIVVK